MGAGLQLGEGSLRAEGEPLGLTAPSLPLLQVFIELNHIKKCNTVRGVFVLEEFGNYTILLLGLDSHGSNSNLGAPEEGLETEKRLCREVRRSRSVGRTRREAGKLAGAAREQAPEQRLNAGPEQCWCSGVPPAGWAGPGRSQKVLGAERPSRAPPLSCAHVARLGPSSSPAPRPTAPGPHQGPAASKPEGGAQGRRQA